MSRTIKDSRRGKALIEVLKGRRGENFKPRRKEPRGGRKNLLKEAGEA